MSQSSVNLIPPLKKGELTKHGYNIKKSDVSRHRALNKAIKTSGGNQSKKKTLSVMRKLNAVKTLTKRTQPKNSKKYSKDMKWIQKKYSEM
jgi:hypothetical protein